MRRRGAACWAWTCSTSTRCGFPGALDERPRPGAGSDERLGVGVSRPPAQAREVVMEGARDLGVATPGATGYQHRWWALGVLCLSLVVLAMDNTILNVALPTLAQDLGATGSQLQWMVDAYLLVFAGLLLTMGALGDRFGRKLALNLGLLVFAAASAASAFASTPEVLIAARAAMGIGAALIMPSTLSIITNTFPPTERGRAIGVWAGMAALGIVLGPVVGGWLLEHFWWGSVFLINLPVVALALLAGWPLVPESRDPGATPLDPTGAALSVAALVTLVYGIIQAPEDGWTDPRILGAFGVAVVLSVAFGWWERRVQHPMLPMELFGNPRFSAASGAIAMAFFALFGSVFLLTQHLQFVLGYTPLQLACASCRWRRWSWRRRWPRGLSSALAPSWWWSPACWWWPAPCGCCRPSRSATATARWRGRWPCWAVAWALSWRRRPSQSWARCRWPRPGSARP